MNKYKTLRRNRGQHMILKQCMLLSILFFSIIFSIGMTSADSNIFSERSHATDVTYYWDRTTGVSVAGYTTNWTSCSSSNPQNGFRIANIKGSTSSCSNGYLTRSSAGDMLLSISPTVYSSAMQIAGKANARFYLRSNSGSATYRFDLGYAKTGTFTSLGNVTRTGVSTSGTTYTIDFSTISGTAPTGSNLALKISVTTSNGGRIYLGANGGTSGSNSGRFYVNESASIPTLLNITAPADVTTISTGINTPVNLGTSIVTGGVSPYTTTNNSPPGGFPVGTTTVTWNTTDFMGATATDTQLVTITPQTPSQLNIVAPIDITTVSTGTYTLVNLGTPTVTGGTPPYTTTNSSPPGGFPVGTTTVTWNTTDFIGATATDTQLVTITPQTPAPGGYKIIVSSDRYSIFSPWTGKASHTSLSANFTGYALLLDDSGKPVAGQGITFKIYSGSGGTILKSTNTAITKANGLASVPYDTYSDFTSSTDTDYGTWKIEAYLTSDPTVISNTRMKIEAGGTGLVGGSSCETYCHKTSTHTGAKPLSPYTAGYGTTSSRAVAAHEKSDHVNKGCYYCHPGYATTKTGSYGNTGDVHKNRTCDFCHGTWSYISSTSGGNGNGIPKMPSCYSCHPVLNSNPSNVSTIATLAGGIGISVYSFNFDQKKPLAAHTGTTFSLVDSVPCLVCHGPAHNNSKPILGTGTSNANTENEQCWTCHTNRETTHKSNTNCVTCHSQNAHNVSIGGGGGPDCISCHDTAGGATHKVDANAIASGEHANLNSGAIAVNVPDANKKCWGCHQTNGIQPASNSMGDRYTNPYKCYDCHNATKPYANVGSALTVSEHSKNGTDIQSAISAADNSASCIICHNTSEMKVSYTESDGLNNGYSLTSHYGKNRSELRTGDAGSTNCVYCHQNGSTVFSSAMSNAENKNMVNHSTSASTPICTTCHSTGKIHDSSLSKPTSSNDTYCKTCHTTKSDHKTLSCAECHANNSVGNSAGRDIHGIKYLQRNNTFSIGSTTNAVDCTTCHQSNIVDGSIGMTPVKISSPLHHSEDVLNGSKWGSYWLSPIEACTYCHNDTKHSATPLGRPLIWNPSYALNTPIGIGTNCADCHYKGAGNYSSMSSTFTGAGKNIPPEITSGSWNGKPGYYNHTLSDYTDSRCKSCHDKSDSTTVSQMMHNVSIGGGGGGSDSDCMSCHNVKQGIFPGIDTTAFTKHINVNTSDGENILSNSDCMTCHYDTTDMSNVFTRTCNDCHTGGIGPIIENHRPVGGVSVNITTGECSTCHNNSIAKYSYSANASTSHYATNTSLISTKDCLSCHKSPANGSLWGGATDPLNSPTFPHSLSTTTKEECYSCHGDISAGATSFHNKTLTKPLLSSVSCVDCHKLGTNMSKTKIDSSVSSTAAHGNKNCSDCHTGASTSNMNTYSIATNQPVTCTICHIGLEHQPSAADVKTTISCKDCHNNDGMYTANSGTNGTENASVHYLNNVTNTLISPYGHTGPINTSNCMNCHGSGGLYTGNVSWGSPVDISISSKRVHTETTIAQCDGCHKDNTVSTLANVDFHNSSLVAGAGGDNCVGCHAGNE